MTPGQIRVFDGLRITTEHVNHLQAAFLSGLQDLREVLGLGQVQHGLAVTVDGGSVTVHPGLAFDRRRNRIVCDEPKSVPASFAPDDAAKYVLVKYEQMEEGVVEGQATLIFDTCSVAVEPALPAADDDRVPIAKLVKAGEDIQVLPLDAPAAEPVPEEAAAPRAPAIRIRQGMVRLMSQAATEDYLTATLAPALRNRLENPAEAPLVLPLLEEELPVAFPASSLTTHALLSATVTVPAPARLEGAPPSESRSECRADGEATVEGSVLVQHSISTNGGSAFDGQGMGRLPLEAATLPGLELLGSAALVLRVARDDSGRIKTLCALEWQGTVTAEGIGAIEETRPSFSWQVSMLWKAIGEANE